METIVRQYVARQIGRLTAGPEGQKGELAELRRGIGKIPGEDPRLWGAFLLELPREHYSRNGEPSREEWAIYTALTLFALHQQGRNPKEEPVYQKDLGLGRAAAGLVESEDDQERILRRFNLVVTSPDIRELAYHLRGLIQLLRAKGIGLDYPALADDLYWWQQPSQTDRIKLKWGRDFYGELSNAQNTKEENE